MVVVRTSIIFFDFHVFKRLQSFFIQCCFFTLTTFAGHDGTVVVAKGHRGHGEYQLHYVLDLSVCLCVRAHLLSHL